MWPNCNMPADSNLEHNSDWKKPLRPCSVRELGKRGVKMGVRQTVPVAFEKSGVATGAAPVSITGARLFGLDAGDWSMIFVGLALSGLFLALT
jgi:hypothetical protein